MQGGRSARQIEGLDLVIGVASASGPRPIPALRGRSSLSGVTGAGEGFGGRQLNVGPGWPGPASAIRVCERILIVRRGTDKTDKTSERGFRRVVWLMDILEFRPDRSAQDIAGTMPAARGRMPIAGPGWPALLVRRGCRYRPRLGAALIMLGNGLPRLRDGAERGRPAAAGSGRQARKRSVPTRVAGHAEWCRPRRRPGCSGLATIARGRRRVV